MATFNKFQPWVEYMVEGANLDSDTFVVALTNSAPTNTLATLSQITEVTYTYMDTAARTLTVSTKAQSGGTYTLLFADKVLTSTGGATGPFRYVVIYDDTVSGDPLVGWYDYGSSITLQAGETLTLDWTTSTLTVA